MKKVKRYFGVMLCGIGFLAAASSQAEELDFYRLNPVLQTLVDAETTVEETIEFVYPKFDESFSDLSRERLKYDLRAQIKNAPWQKGGKGTVVGSSTYQSDRTPRHTGVTISLSAMNRTDVLAVIRYAATVALKKKTEANPEYDSRINAHLKRLAVATSIEEVGELLFSSHQIAKDMVDDEVRKWEKDLACLIDGTCRDRYYSPVQSAIESVKKTLQDWVRIKEQLNALKINLQKDNQNGVLLTIESDSINEMLRYVKNPLRVGKTKIIFAREFIDFQNESFYKMHLGTLDQLKQDFKRYLSGVQMGDAGSKSYVQDHFRKALIEYKKAIRGDTIR